MNDIHTDGPREDTDAEHEPSEKQPPSPLELALDWVGASPGLVSRNVKIAGRRTSIRLALGMWEALKEIAAEEGLSLDELLTQVDTHRPRKVRLSNFVRTFALGYCRRRWLDSLAEAGEPGAGGAKDAEPNGTVEGGPTSGNG